MNSVFLAFSAFLTNCDLQKMAKKISPAIAGDIFLATSNKFYWLVANDCCDDVAVLFAASFDSTAK